MLLGAWGTAHFFNGGQLSMNPQQCSYLWSPHQLSEDKCEVRRASPPVAVALVREVPAPAQSPQKCTESPVQLTLCRSAQGAGWQGGVRVPPTPEVTTNRTFLTTDIEGFIVNSKPFLSSLFSFLFVPKRLTTPIFLISRFPSTTSHPCPLALPPLPLTLCYVCPPPPPVPWAPQANLVRREWVKPGAVVIDVGIPRRPS